MPIHLWPRLSRCPGHPLVATADRLGEALEAALRTVGGNKTKAAQLVEQRMEDVRSERQLAFDALRKQKQENLAVEAAMNHEVALIHERIMGIRKASFTIRLNSNAHVKHPLNLDLRIDDDGNHSVERTKVFIYDCALMFAPCTRERHPQFLLHDNIFDVDHDTLVQCLNYLQEQVDRGEDFQYVLTLNREKIEAEERAQLIKLDVSAATRATLTKATPFLGFRYQESRWGSAEE